MHPLIPVTKKYIYLNAAATGPLSLPAKESMEQALKNYAENGRIPDPVWQKDVEETRALAGKLIGAPAEQIAFIRNTSDGIIFAIESIPWQEGDNIILFKDGFPANRLPFENLLPANIERRYVSIRNANPELEIINMIDKHTRAISIDWVDFLTGRRINLEYLIEKAKKDGIFLIVDAIQGLGALKLNTSGISILTSGASKWMLGPYGTGILYVSSETMKRLKPSRIGWLSFAWKDYSRFDVIPPLIKGAGMYEPGTKNIIGLYGLRANIELLLNEGIENIERKIIKLCNMFKDGLKGWKILTPEQERHSGILTVKNGDKTEKIYKKLNDNNIVVSFREGWIRISPHFYNTEEEVEKTMQMMQG